MKIFISFFIFISTTALATEEEIIIKKSPGLRYQYMETDDGRTHLVDTWISLNDVVKSTTYSPDIQNVYHLFTRANPRVSQPLVYGNLEMLTDSNFNASRRTVVLVHGWTAGSYSFMGGLAINTIPAYLHAEDVNILVVDWTAGSGDPDYGAAILHTITSGVSVGRFLDWLNTKTGASYSRYHLAGHSLGGQQVGIIGRSVGGAIAYITATDPAGPGWHDNEYTFQPSDGVYTEVIHTNAGMVGYAEPLGDTDFYPNGGLFQPCIIPLKCDHERSNTLFAESIFRGGFTSTQCEDYQAARDSECHMSNTLHMGGRQPKTGSTGIFWLPTNSKTPFSKG